MDKDYLNILQKTNLRPDKVKLKEKKEEILLEQDRGESDIHAEIIKWTIKNPKASIEDATAFSKELGIELSELEHHIFMILANILAEGYSKGKEIKHDPAELEMGIKVEMEHTSEPLISRKIALDHLTEIPDYYTRLAKMEKEAGAKPHSE